jgi:hypothetical protein
MSITESFELYKQPLVERQEQLTKSVEQVQQNKINYAQQEADIIDSLNKAEALDTKSADQIKEAQKTIETAKKEHGDLAKLKQENFEQQLDNVEESKDIKAQYDDLDSDQAKYSEQEIEGLTYEQSLTEDELDNGPLTEQKIAQKQQQLAEETAQLEKAKDASVKAEKAAEVQNTKNAANVKESCPIKCEANKIIIKSNKKNRNYVIETQKNSDTPTLHVLSISQAALKSTKKTDGISVISVVVEGKCEKGKLSSSPDSSLIAKDNRNTGSTYCPVVKVKKNPVDILLPADSARPLDFRVYCPEPPSRGIKWDYLLSHIFTLARKQYNMYTIETDSCEGDQYLVGSVAAHPKIKINLAFSMAFKPLDKKEAIPPLPSLDTPTKKNPIEFNGKEAKLTASAGPWNFELALAGSVDNVTLTDQLKYLDPNELLKPFREALTIFLFIFDVIRLCTGENIPFTPPSRINKEVKKEIEEEKKEGDNGSNIIKMAVEYPKLKLALGYENCEATGKNTLGHLSTLDMNFDPLIGVNCKVDILGALIKIAMNSLLPGSAAGAEKFKTYIVPVLEKLLKDEGKLTVEEAEDRNFKLEAGILLELKVGARITAKGNWTHEFESQSQLQTQKALLPVSDGDTNAASAGGTLDMVLRGKIYAKGKVWKVNFDAGLIVAMAGAAKAGEEADIKAAQMEYKLSLTTEGDEPMVDGAFIWNGLALLYMSYTEVNVSSDDSGNEVEGELTRGFDTPPPPKKENKNEDQKLVKIASDKNSKMWELIAPGRYPEKPEKTPLVNYINPEFKDDVH